MAVVLTREERHLEFAVRRVLSTDKESVGKGKAPIGKGKGKAPPPPVVTKG
jgi:hypothetical protein